MFRALKTEDYQLLRQCVNEKNKVSNLNSTWGPHTNMTPLVIAIMRNDLKAIEEIVSPHSLRVASNRFSLNRDNLNPFRPGNPTGISNTETEKRYLYIQRV